MKPNLKEGGLRYESPLGCGLTLDMVKSGVAFAYNVLDLLDDVLIRKDLGPLSGLIELANLSTVVGNLMGRGIIRASGGVFEQAGPHKYQDLRTTGRSRDACHVEIKTALETNAPKGHLPKAGHYLTVRYVLLGSDGKLVASTRGESVWIWEIRFGELDLTDFNLSSTAGDSGKTAVVNKAGMEKLKVIYLDEERCPYGPRSPYRKSFTVSPTTAPIPRVLPRARAKAAPPRRSV